MTAKHYEFHYPSGKLFRVFGEFRVKSLPGIKVVPVMDVKEHTTIDGVDIPAEHLLMIDQRAVVQAEDGEVVYEPRGRLRDLTKEMRSWMLAHRDWPKRVQLNICPF